MTHRPAPLTDFGDDVAARTSLYDTVENQVRDGTPPAAAAALARLLAAGHARDDAINLIACALSVEFCEILQHDGTYDEARYSAHLEALPDLPYDAGG